ncbi:undecaprenyl-diphosphate phosphatase [Mycoplasmatota bacterium]|nr:undecaprenyl-diphosphate phosphatase [Mycoplasmatota bacterium]
MEYLKLIILSLIQGITEPLPISSSGHMVLFEELFSVNLPGLYFETLVNFGSLFAIVIFYYKDIFVLVTKSTKYLVSRKEGFDEFKYLMLVVIATIPAGIIGFLFSDFIEVYLKNIMTVSVFLILTGLMLISIEKVEVKRKDCVSFFDSILIGISQIIALIPGVSRSGATTVTGLSRGLKIEEALKFSFMMYIPISLLSGIYGIYNLNESVGFSFIYVICFLVALMTTYHSIKWLIKVVKNSKLYYFATYCFIVGFSVLTYLVIK